MPPDVDVVAARDAVHSDRAARYRTFTWWSTTNKGDPLTASSGVPVAEIFPTGPGYRRWYDAAEAQMPRVLATRDCSAAGPVLREASRELELRRARTWLLMVPTGSIVAGLQLELDHRDPSASLRPLISLLTDVDSERERLTIGGESVLSACQLDSGLDLELAFAGDMHHLTFVDEPVPDDRAERRDLLQRMVSRQDRASHEEYLTATFPAELNRYPGGFAAVTPGATIIGGQPTDVQLAACVNAVLAIASLADLRKVQSQAFAALRTLRDPSENELEWLLDRTAEPRRLELDLSFGIESHLEMRVLVPSLPIEQLHGHLVEALGLRRGAALTGGMLARLSTAISAEEAAVRLQQRESAQKLREKEERDARRERVAAARRRQAATAAVGVAGLVALPLAFLGINASEVSERRSMFDLNHYWPYYLAILLLVAVTVGIAHALARRFIADIED